MALLSFAVHVAVAMDAGTLIDRSTCVGGLQNGEPVLRSPRCVAGCTMAQCGECRCRTCEMCACGKVDPLTGVMLSDAVCGHVDAMRQQFYLGQAATPAQCAKLCDNHYRPDQGHLECTMWNFVNGACVGSFMASLVQPGDLTKAAVGFSTCAPEGAVKAAAAAHRAAAAPSFAMVHTVGSMAVTPSLAARMARARAQFVGTPHFYRVAQVSRGGGTASSYVSRFMA
jgi:hypothetical protein